MTPEEMTEAARARAQATMEALDKLEQQAAAMVQQCEDIVGRLCAVEQLLERVGQMHADVQKALNAAPEKD